MFFQIYNVLNITPNNLAMSPHFMKGSLLILDLCKGKAVVHLTVMLFIHKLAFSITFWGVFWSIKDQKGKKKVDLPGTWAWNLKTHHILLMWTNVDNTIILTHCILNQD